LTAQGVEYDRGVGNPTNIKQFSTARIVVIATFTIVPGVNQTYIDYDTGVPVTAQARKNLRLGFQYLGGGLVGVNTAAINNTVYWGFTLGNGRSGNKLEYTRVDGVPTSSRILLNFRFRTESVVSVSANYLVKLYTYG
jgi:hypothetical protein